MALLQSLLRVLRIPAHAVGTAYIWRRPVQCLGRQPRRAFGVRTLLRLRVDLAHVARTAGDIWRCPESHILRQRHARVLSVDFVAHRRIAHPIFLVLCCRRRCPMPRLRYKLRRIGPHRHIAALLRVVRPGCVPCPRRSRQTVRRARMIAAGFRVLRSLRRPATPSRTSACARGWLPHRSPVE